MQTCRHRRLVAFLWTDRQSGKDGRGGEVSASPTFTPESLVCRGWEEPWFGAGCIPTSPCLVWNKQLKPL